MENPIKMDDLGVKPTIFGNIHVLKHGFVEKFFPSSLRGLEFDKGRVVFEWKNEARKRSEV